MEPTVFLKHMPRNLWRTWERVNFPINGLVLYLPLWHPELTGSPIISKDLNAHSCAVIGATWGATGRIFAGGDDLITVTTSSALNAFDWNTDFSVAAWFKTSQNFTTFGDILIKRTTGGKFPFGMMFRSTEALQFDSYDGATGYAVITTGTFSDGLPHFALMLHNGTTHKFKGYIDGVYQGESGAEASTTANTENLILGTDTTLGRWYYGIESELWAYNRLLSTAEGEQIRRATKWRYQ